MKNKVGATIVAFGLITGMGAVGAVEAQAQSDSLALEVVTQTWYELPNNKQQRYCDTKNVKRIVKVHHKGLAKESKKDLRKAYRVFLKDC